MDHAILGAGAIGGLIGTALASLGEDVTLPQFRALVVLRTRGPQRAADLAALLNVTASTSSRMIERLVRKHLVRRVRTPDDRRTVRVSITETGRALHAAFVAGSAHPLLVLIVKPWGTGAGVDSSMIAPRSTAQP